MHLIQIALPVPMYTAFDYACDSLPKLGVRVVVPFGQRTLIGIVLAHLAYTDVASDKLKTVIDILDDEPLFDSWRLEFAQFLSRYYHYPIGETLAAMLPVALKEGKPLPTPTMAWQACDIDEKTLKSRLKNAKTHAAAYTLIRDNPHSHTLQLQILGITPATLSALQAKALITPTPYTATPATLKESPLTLNGEQQAALTTIEQALGDYRGILLNGVTGSGKTEVYLQAINKVLQTGAQVLVLVPEIGLTPQSRHRFEQRFAANIIVLHSRLNDTERLHGYQACRTGTAQIVIATRSALFYPFKNLGLIIIDEAHDTSFKQVSDLRYHACDVALYLGYRQHIPVVLGTATPSLEQYQLIQDGKLTECKLTQRAGVAQMAKFRLIDLRLGTMWHTDIHGVSQNTELSPITITAIKDTLKRGEQVMVFLNRRGFSPILLCAACGWQADCIRCSSHLTLHKSNLKKSTHTNTAYLHNYLKCHHCNYQVITPTHCPSCHSENLISLGQGTSQLYERLHALFSNAQTTTTPYPLVQIDRDTVATKGAWEQLFRQINTGEPMILVGTQMIAKGHHFDRVSLVVIVDADAGFLSPNFRSPEHTAQTIMQVAGRAGRADTTGTVLIQTYNPNNPTLTTLIRDGYEPLALSLLAERRQLGLPPTTHAALIQADARSYDAAKNAIIAARQYLDRFTHDFSILAPIDAPITKKNNRYHVQMLILARHRMELHSTLDGYWQNLLTLPSSKGVRLSIDIDPIGW